MRGAIEASEKLRDRIPGDAGWGEDKSRKVRVDHGDWAVQKVGAGEAFGDDVAGLHHFEGKFKGVGVIEAAADNDGVLHEAVAAGKGSDLGLQLEGLFCQLGQLLQIFKLKLGTEGVSEQIHGQQLAGVGFSGSY